MVGNNPDIKIKTAYWYLTFRCNLSCRHCFLKCNPNIDTRYELNTEECMDLIHQMNDLGINFIKLTGGEPLIRKDFTNIVKEIADNGMSYAIETNGVLITDHILEILDKTKDYLRLIAVSLDGASEKTNSLIRGKGVFDRVVKNIKKLTDRELPVEIMFTINRLNMNDAVSVYKLAEKLRVKYLKYSFVVLKGRAYDNRDVLGLPYKSYIDIINKIVEVCEKNDKNSKHTITILCVPPIILPLRFWRLNNVKCVHTCDLKILGILPNGDISFCSFGVYLKENIFGNVRSKPIKEILEENKMKILDILKQIQPEMLQGICAKCIFKQYCRGGCRLEAYSTYGSFNAPFPLCQALYQAGLINNMIINPHFKEKIYMINHNNQYYE